MQTPSFHLVRRLPAVAIVVTVFAVTACSNGTNGNPTGATTSSPSGSSSSSASAGSSSSAPESSATQSSVPATGGSLSKADFITQMNAVCADTDKQRNAVATPSSMTDYTGIHKYFTETLAMYQAYVTQAVTLVAKSPDAAELTEKWLKIEQSDFAVAGPYIAQLITAAAAKDAAKVSDLLNRIDQLPDHSTEYSTYLTSYGLTACATLASS